LNFKEFIRKHYSVQAVQNRQKEHAKEYPKATEAETQSTQKQRNKITHRGWAHKHTGQHKSTNSSNYKPLTKQ
jgi:hypothetical protein